MNKCSLTLVIIACLGLWLRYDTYNTRHPDNDDLYELQRITIEELDFKRVFDNKQLYGDHTSFPGEFLLYYIPLKLLKKDIQIDMGNLTISGLTKKESWLLNVPKVIITVLGFLCLVWVWRNNVFGILGMMMYAFNFQLIYHALAFRPYGVLPELAIFNFLLCSACFEKGKAWLWVPYSTLFFITCIYHAYGILIAGLPLLYCMIEGRHYKHPILPIMPVILVSFSCWVYYASFNTFGWTPNAAQGQVDTFQYMSKTGFFNNLFLQLTGGGLIMYALCPILLFRAFRFEQEDWLYLGILILLPLTLIFLVSIKSHAWILPRYFIWVIPFFIMFCVAEVEKWSQN